MIELRIRLWTNRLGTAEGHITPKHAWDSGVVFMQRNASHGIEAKTPKPFHSMMDLTAIVEKVLIAHGVKLHSGSRSQKYLVLEN